MRRAAAAPLLAAAAAAQQFCADGLLDGGGTVCCPAACGRCGGSSCQNRPGGSAKCCTGGIEGGGRVCAAPSDTACIIPTPGSHADELACELNGRLQSGKCACRPGWTGATCGLLDFAPAASGGGFHEPGSGSWGFSIPGPMPHTDGKYYAVVAFMPNHPGISNYGGHMGLTMAVSDAPEGPYTRMVQPMSETLFAPVYSGNPGASYDPVTKTYFLLHQGCGTQPKANSSCGHGAPVMAMSAPTPHGPWTEYGPVFNGSTQPYPQWDEWASNAVPVSAPDGKKYLMYRSHGYVSTPATGSKHFGEYLGLAVADRWQGPYTKVQEQPIISESNEDPFMWVDKQTGYFHAITHLEKKIPQPPSPVAAQQRGVAPASGGAARVQGGSKGGRHIWSLDGKKWYSTTDHLALGEVVQLDNGTTWSLSRRERPCILFHADGSTPRVVFSGVQLGAPDVFVLAQPVRS